MKDFKVKDNDYVKYYYSDGMVKERWETGTPKPIRKFYKKNEDLIRTAYFYLAYGHNLFINGIKKCIERDEQGKIKIWRSTDKNIYLNVPSHINDIDRNTICNLCWVLFLMEEHDLLNDIINNYSEEEMSNNKLNFIDKLWFGYISRKKPSKKNAYKFFPIHLLFFIFIFPFSFFDNYNNVLTIQMQISISGNGFLKKFCSWLYRFSADKNNFLSRVLLGETIDKRYLKDIFPRNGFPFNVRFNEYFNSTNNLRVQSAEESEYNELDKYLVIETQKKLNDLKYKNNV